MSLLDRPRSGDRAILVHVDTLDENSRENLEEFRELAESAGVETIKLIVAHRDTPDPKYFLGKGKAEEIKQWVTDEEAELVLVNHQLTPTQERNLERLLQCRVLNRTGLILDIFARRARTFEGKLQVELAQLQHLSTRLVRGWSHLERQKGGIGLRGPGETQLETDRRLLRHRIKTIQQRLVKVRRQRNQNRQARNRSALPTVAIVGYTNAGKSTLFNNLTEATIYTADKLFATLDPTLRKIDLPGSKGAILADTVGFIRHLPHDLVEAFRATLEETRVASLLLHIVDITHPRWRENISDVNCVLQEIGASHVPQIMIFNKIDVLADQQPKVEYDEDRQLKQVWISAKKSLGLDLLRQSMVESVYGTPMYRTVRLTPKEGKLRAELYQLNAVVSERIDEEGHWILALKIAKIDFERLFLDSLSH